jgi:hypothetical protein
MSDSQHEIEPYGGKDRSSGPSPPTRHDSRSCTASAKRPITTTRSNLWSGPTPCSSRAATPPRSSTAGTAAASTSSCSRLPSMSRPASSASAPVSSVGLPTVGRTLVRGLGPSPNRPASGRCPASDTSTPGLRPLRHLPCQVTCRTGRKLPPRNRAAAHRHCRHRRHQPRCAPPQLFP